MDDVVRTLLDALAAADECEPVELDFALQDHIDVDALESLLAHPDGSWTLSFEVPDHSVTVTGDGVVLVDGDSVERELPV
jgi:hypothetical protein